MERCLLERPGTLFPLDVHAEEASKMAGCQYDIIATDISNRVLEKPRAASIRSLKSSVGCLYADAQIFQAAAG